MAKTKIIINDIECFQDLCQGVYEETQAIINQANDEAERLRNATVLKDEIIDGKARYASAIHNFIQDKDKAIGRRIEIAKLLQDLIKNQGNFKATMENPENVQAINTTGFDLESWKKKIKESEAQSQNVSLY